MEKRAKRLMGYYNDNFGGEQREAGDSPPAHHQDGDAVIANGMFARYLLKL